MKTVVKPYQRLERHLIVEPRRDCKFFMSAWCNGHQIIECYALNAPYCGMETKPCRFYQKKKGGGNNGR